MNMTNKHQLNTITTEQVREAYNKQIKNQEWNFFDERKHVEDLLCQRFNFLILAFSLFITAFSTINGETNKLIILIIGFIVILLISLTIIRAYYKLDVNLKILYKLQEAEDSDNYCYGYNAMSIIDNEIKMKTRNKKRWFLLNNMNKTIGVWIPLTFITLFGIGIIAMSVNIWKIDEEVSTTDAIIRNSQTLETPHRIQNVPILKPYDNK